MNGGVELGIVGEHFQSCEPLLLRIGRLIWVDGVQDGFNILKPLSQIDIEGRGGGRRMCGEDGNIFRVLFLNFLIFGHGQGDDQVATGLGL